MTELSKDVVAPGVDDALRCRADMHSDPIEQLVFELSWELEEASLDANDYVTVNREKLRAIATRIVGRGDQAAAALQSQCDRYRGLIGEAFDFLGGIDDASEIRAKLLPALSDNTTSESRS